MANIYIWTIRLTTAGCSARQNTGENYFVDPKTTPPDPALTLNLT